MYEAMKEDILRHETLAFELALKFESQHDLLLQFSEHIEALKSHSLSTDLHFEAYLPLQTATIAYEISKGIVANNRIEKFQSHFATKIVKNLEKNMLKIIDPESTELSRF